MFTESSIRIDFGLSQKSIPGITVEVQDSANAWFMMNIIKFHIYHLKFRILNTANFKLKVN